MRRDRRVNSFCTLAGFLTSWSPASFLAWPNPSHPACISSELIYKVWSETNAQCKITFIQCKLERLCKTKYFGASYSLSDSFRGQPALISHLDNRPGPTSLHTTTSSGLCHDGGAHFHRCPGQSFKKLAGRKLLVNSLYEDKTTSVTQTYLIIKAVKYEQWPNGKKEWQCLGCCHNRCLVSLVAKLLMQFTSRSLWPSRKGQVVTPGLDSVHGWCLGPYCRLSPAVQIAAIASRWSATWLICQVNPSKQTFFSSWGQSWSWLASSWPRRASRRAVMESKPLPKASSLAPSGSVWTTAKSTSKLAVTRPKKSLNNGVLKKWFVISPCAFVSDHTS